MEECIFCKIIAGKIPAVKVLEDEKVIAFLDIMPANKGHCLVIPKNHASTLTDMEDNDVSCCMHMAKKIAKAMSLGFGNGSYNLVMNNGKEAGQLVNHAHFHVIPRFQKDRLRIKWSHLKYNENEINEFAEKIRKFL